jgi:tetratricopeptide (TPR) repeat protein/predicted aspartyl protease
MRALRIFCLGIGVLVAGHAWADGCKLNSYGTLPVEMVGYQPTTVVKINGTDTRFMLDTGAFVNTMSKANADSLKLETRFAPVGFYITGVGGEANAEITKVKDFGLVGVTLHDIGFLVGGSDVGYGLLGANLLDFADLEIDLADGKVTLFRPEDCGNTVLAYWVKNGGSYNVVDLEPSKDSRDQRTFFSVTINGKKVRAQLDSGAGDTILSRSAAERVGIDLSAPGVKAGSHTSGIGAKLVKAWIVPVDSFSVGTETIQHSQMQVIDGTFGDDDTDMLLGADFLLAHRMFIANGKGKAYFTYNGGRVFAFAAAPGDGDKSDVGNAADKESATPKTASDYALLGQAHLSRGEPNAAIADLNEAIRLAPDQADYYLARARTQLMLKQPDAALADLGQCLSLAPRNADALLLRAQVRFWRKDHEGAAADAAAANALVPAGSAQARSLADLYLSLGQPAVALPLFDDWIRLHGDDAMLGSALNQRCWARSLSNQMLDDALNDCREAIHRDGEKPNYLDSLGMVELRIGHYPESIKAYQQAIAGQKGSAWSHYGLGMAEIRNGQADAGNADLAAARALDPQIEALAGKYGLTAAGQ